MIVINKSFKVIEAFDDYNYTIRSFYITNDFNDYKHVVMHKWLRAQIDWPFITVIF